MEPSPVDRPRWRTLAAGLVLGLALGGGLAAAAFVVVGRSARPADGSADAGFARDMATHHAQAVDMAFLVRDASTDERLRTLAYDIIVTQTAQRGVFMGWLQQWGLPQASTRPRMAWMPMPGHATHTETGLGAMAGMASDAEMADLRAAKGRDRESLFLQLMIRHHEGGVLMARSVLAQSRREEVATMASQIDRGQSAEIAVMTGMLAERGARPLPSILR